MKKKHFIIIAICIVGIIVSIFIPKFIEYFNNIQIEKERNNLIYSAKCFYDNQDYVNAYTAYLKLEDKDKADECYLKILDKYLYEDLDYIFEKEKIFSNNINVKIHIVTYLKDVGIPSKDKCLKIIELLNYCELDYAEIYINSLKAIAEDKIYIDESRYDPSFHIDGDIENVLLENPQTLYAYDKNAKNMYIGADKTGIYFNYVYHDSATESTYSVKNYIRFGDYSSYHFLKVYDGKWFYFFNDGKLIRIDLDFNEDIIADFDYDNVYNLSAYLYLNDLLFLKYYKDDKLIIDRYYLPLKEKKTINTNINKIMNPSITLFNSSLVRVKQCNDIFTEIYLKALEDDDFLKDVLEKYNGEEYLGDIKEYREGNIVNAIVFPNKALESYYYSLYSDPIFENRDYYFN